MALLTQAANKAAISGLFVGIILCSATASSHGQSALDGFDPNANGTVEAVALQADGKVLVGGDFTTVAPRGGASVSRNHLARFNPDGTLDTRFDPDVNNIVRAIAVDANGNIVIGGDFTVIGTGRRIIRGHIARLGKDGAVDATFNPNANSTVRAIAIQADGRILAGGDFSVIGGLTRKSIARLNATDGKTDGFNPNATGGNVLCIGIQRDEKIVFGGTFSGVGDAERPFLARVNSEGVVESTFEPKPTGGVFSLVIHPDGNILVGGSFTSIGGTTRNRIARLKPDKGLADSWNPGASDIVLAIALQGDGKVVAGGAFSNIGGQPRNHIARIDQNTGLCDSFNPNANAVILAIAVQQDGKIVVGGAFNGANSIRFSTRNFIARLEIDGLVDHDLILNVVSSAGGFIETMAVQTDGKILIGGFFSQINGLPRNNIARLNTDGTIDGVFNPGTDGSVDAIAVLADGNIIVGGDFHSVDGQPRNHIAKLGRDAGTLDPFFDPNANFSVESIAIDGNGMIVVGGQFISINGFNSIGGKPRNHLARLDPLFGQADDFDAQVSGFDTSDLVSCVAIDPNGMILVGGTFHSQGGANSIGGQVRNFIGRLDPVTAQADSFNPQPNGEVESIAIEPGGSVLMGGLFTTVGGSSRNHIARVDALGALDNGFNPNANDEVSSIAVQADGKVLIGGHFSTLSPNGGAAVNRNGLARLLPSGAVESTFDAGASGGPSNGAPTITGIGLLADGKILVGGRFTTIGGQNRILFARLSNDTAALQHLIVTQTQLTLTRGGSSPQFTRATFESSTDNLNFTFLGDAKQSGTSWTLSGLNLPNAQDIIIRARGFYRSGDDNGSESATGTRRSAFFPGNFVIGDRNAVVGQHVVFSSPHWAKSNSLTGGPAPASFKGFASSTSLPSCGDNWQSDPGNGATPPSGTAPINVIVASSITKSGAAILGNVLEMAVVEPDPDHPGTGTVISLSCDEP